MKKFKLIKEYPASPKLGFIVLERHCGLYHNIETGNMYGSQMIENQPEYWEEVIEKDYEVILARRVPYTILSVRRLSDGEVFSVGDRAKTITSNGRHTVTQLRIRQKCTGRDGKGGYNYDGIDRIWIDWEDDCGGNWLESTEKIIENDYEIISYVAKDNPTNITIKRRGAHLHEEYWTIHTVKRLSDGEIFTVGDKITGYHKDARSIQTIRICTHTGRVRLEQSGGYTDLSYATKAKQPIFLTHDGKDIFVGDRIIWVNKDSLLHGTFTTDYGSLFCSSQHAYFISAVDAQEYIQKNTVCLSYNDVVEAICLNGYGKGSLQELVNKKLEIK